MIAEAQIVTRIRIVAIHMQDLTVEKGSRLFKLVISLLVL